VTLVELIDKAMMRRVIVWLLMCLAIPLYVGAAYLYSTSWPESVKPLSPGIEKVFFVGSCALAVSSLIIYRRLLSVRRLQDCLNRAPDVRQLAIDATFGTDGEDILRKIDSLDPWELRLLIIPAFLVRPLLVSTSLNSMIAFLGLILSLLTRRFLYSIPFAAAALVLNGLVFPRIKPLIDRANGMRDNLEAFR
jgi:hypothetical protein